ncbi:MAG: hypothetical protein ABSG46_09290 [Candidatus Binataceae bacterium]
MNPAPTQSFINGSDRDLITIDEAEALKRSGALIIDERRSRTRYFDGRYFAAKDAMRDQDYVLARLADLGRASGSGVVAGLLVSLENPTTLIIEPGQGVTLAGETLIVPKAVTVALADLAGAEQLDVAFGLSRIPSDPGRNRTGLFIVGLRPVEYTANPIASYPLTLSGPRSMQDGDIIEAAAVVLAPYEQGARGSADARRSQAARQIFLENARLGVPANVLPLAMIAMDRGIVQWLDTYMVRREVGAEQGSILGFGLTRRAVREAHIQQHLAHLREVLQVRTGGNLGHEFAASEHFDALPAVGMLPAAAINLTDFTQIYFPAHITADISIIPSDELPVVIEESLMLPEIDLTATGDELESTSVLLLVPVSRAQLPSLKLSLGSMAKPLRPAAPGMIFQRKPLQALAGMTAVRQPPPLVDTGKTIDSGWRQAIGQNSMLWYVRRRNLHLSEEVTGTPVPLAVDEEGSEKATSERLAKMGLADRVGAINAKSTTAAKAEVNARLASPAMDHPIVAESVVHELEQHPKIDHATAISVTQPFSEPGMGEGIARLEQANPVLKQPEVAKTVAAARVTPELDRVARAANEAKLKELADQIAHHATAPPPEPPHEVEHHEPPHISEPEHHEPPHPPEHQEPPHSAEPPHPPAPHPAEAGHPEPPHEPPHVIVEPHAAVPVHKEPPHVAIQKLVLSNPEAKK